MFNYICMHCNSVTSHITFSNSPAYPNPTRRILSPPTAYRAPNPPTPIMDEGTSDIFSSAVEERDDVAGGAGKVT
jgi:hypothetical protein